MSGLFRNLLLIGGALLTAFSARLPEQLQDAGLASGVVFVAVGLFALSWSQLRKRRAGRMSFTDAAILSGVALILIGAAVVFFGFVYDFRNGTAPVVTPTSQFSPTISDPIIEWNGKGIASFSGTFTRSGEKLPIYLDFANEGPGVAGNNQYVVDGPHGPWPRIQIGFVEQFARGQRLNVPLAEVYNIDERQQVLRWGSKEYKNQPVGATWSNYSGRVVIVRNGGVEESYPFVLVSRAVDGKPAPPLFIGPGTIESVLKSARQQH